MQPEFQQRAAELVDAGRLLYRMGMVPATSGNFSARLTDNTLAITVSGRHKGRLADGDIMLADAAGHSLDGNRPSAETLLHVQIYNRFPAARCILHPHSVNATLLSLLAEGDIVLRDYEILAEHTHSDFEVRFFVDGNGLFYLHVADRVYAILCEKGDLISVPEHSTHWFDMGAKPDFKCIRFFVIPDGWGG